MATKILLFLEVRGMNVTFPFSGLDYIEKLQEHEHPDIYKLCYEIIEQYFSDVSIFQKYIFILRPHHSANSVACPAKI